MKKKGILGIFIGVGLLALGMGTQGVSAAEFEESVDAAGYRHSRDVRFTCTFEGPAVVVKGAIPLVCTAFGQFDRPMWGGPGGGDFDGDGDSDNQLTVICGNSVVYSDGVIATFPSNTTTELRSIVPGVATVTMRSLNPGMFSGPLGSVLRVDMPGTPQALLTGVCHLNHKMMPPSGPFNPAPAPVPAPGPHFN
jgi:hypothetical protein